MIHYFGCFSVALVIVTTTTDERKLQCRCNVDHRVSSDIDAASKLRSGWWVVWPNISSVTGDDIKAGCSGRMCRIRVNIVLAK